jgi:beta-lactamase regulating signal transducer with metallopeptidase domain
VVALPSALLRDLDRSNLERVLAHELAHVRRYDDWGNLLQQVVRAVWFMNPIVHIACRRLDVDREIACDDLVAADRTDRLE